MTDIIGISLTPKENGICVGIRGMRPKYMAVWAMLNKLPREHMTEPWDDFPWSGFTTQYEYIILEMGKIAGTENVYISRDDA